MGVGEGWGTLPREKNPVHSDHVVSSFKLERQHFAVAFLMCIVSFETQYDILDYCIRANIFSRFVTTLAINVS